MYVTCDMWIMILCKWKKWFASIMSASDEKSRGHEWSYGMNEFWMSVKKHIAIVRAVWPAHVSFAANDGLIYIESYQYWNMSQTCHIFIGVRSSMMISACTLLTLAEMQSGSRKPCEVHVPHVHGMCRVWLLVAQKTLHHQTVGCPPKFPQCTGCLCHNDHMTPTGEKLSGHPTASTCSLWTWNTPKWFCPKWLSLWQLRQLVWSLWSGAAETGRLHANIQLSLLKLGTRQQHPVGNAAVSTPFPWHHGNCNLRSQVCMTRAGLRTPSRRNWHKISLQFATGDTLSWSLHGTNLPTAKSQMGIAAAHGKSASRTVRI